MSLPALRLDDLTWEDLRLLAQRRIPAASGGAWTHHAPVDPGITLLELFAFLLEQQLYVLDQVPDSLVRAVLTLLGEAPRPIGVARTVLTAQTAPPDASLLAPGMIVRPQPVELADLLYTVTSSAVVLPLDAVTVEIGGIDRTPTACSDPLRLMPADARPAAFDIVLRLAAPAPADLGPLSLLLEIDTPARIAAAWSADAASAPPPAILEFASVASGIAKRLAADAVSDGTLGLRRSGLLVVAWQSDWDGASEIRLRVTTAAATFAAPPRLRRIWPNAVTAIHSVEQVVDGRALSGDPIDTARAAIADQLDHWLPLSNLQLDLPPILGSPIDGTVELSLTRPGPPPVSAAWENVADLACAGPTDRQFTLDRPRGRLHFGDGYTGRVPAPASDFSLRMQAGGGPGGNLPEEIGWETIEGLNPPLRALINRMPASGGHEAEALKDARARVAGSLARSDRVVTEPDIRELVETMPALGPHRAHVVVGFDPAFPCSYIPDSIGVFVVPRVPRDGEADRAEVPTPKADPGALALFAQRLDAARMLATRIHVITPKYRAVALTITIRTARPDAANLCDAVKMALARHLDAVVGGEGEGWNFGHPLRPSELVRVAQSAGGEEIFVERVAVGIDGNAPKEDCVDTRIGPHDLVFLASAAFRVLLPEQGGSP